MPWKISLTLAIALLGSWNSPACAVEPLPVAPSQLADALAEKTAVLTGECVSTNSSNWPVFGVDLMLGQQSGIRPSLAVYSNERSAFLVEGYYGGLFTKFGGSEGAGAGVRWVTSRGGSDSVTIGPGVDVLFNFNDGKATFLAPTVDIAWRREFGNRAGFVLGLNAGIGIGLSGNSGSDEGDRVSGKVTPLISLFTGLRY